MLATLLLHRMVNMNITRRIEEGKQAEISDQRDIKPSRRDYCRTCLSTANLRPIFSNSRNQQMSHKLKLVTSLEIKRNDGLSQKICNKCLRIINIALIFRDKCRETEKSLLGMAKQTITNETEISTKNIPATVNVIKVEYDAKSNDFQNDIKLKEVKDIKPNIYECLIQTADQKAIQRDVKFSFNEVPVDWVKNPSNTDEQHSYGENISTRKEDISEAVKVPLKTAAERQKAYRERIKQQNPEKHDTIQLKTADGVPYSNNIKSIQEQNKEVSRREKEVDAISPRGQRVRQTYERHSVAGPPYTCDKCGKQFMWKSSYIAHMRSYTNYIICEECGKKCRNMSELTQHRRALHGLARIHKCSYCDHHASSQERLTGHERRHTGERPYVCDYCAMAFYTRRTLKQHIGIHLPDTIQCPYCPKKLRSQLMLSNHKAKKHGKIYSFQCPSCPLVYKSNKAAHYHYKMFHQTSTDERPKIAKILLYSERKEIQQNV